jgi:hypothetical protein
MTTTKKAAIKKTAPAVTGEVLARLSPMLTAWSKAEKEAEDQAKITVDVAHEAGIKAIMLGVKEWTGLPVKVMEAYRETRTAVFKAIAEGCLEPADFKLFLMTADEAKKADKSALRIKATSRATSYLNDFAAALRRREPEYQKAKATGAIKGNIQAQKKGKVKGNSEAAKKAVSELTKIESGLPELKGSDKTTAVSLSGVAAILSALTMTISRSTDAEIVAVRAKLVEAIGAAESICIAH